MSNELIDGSLTTAVNKLQYQLWKTAEDHGFHDAQRIEAAPAWVQSTLKLALITSEIGEAVNALRSGDETDFAEELADIFIRLLDLAEECEISIISEVKLKAEANIDRPHLHNKLF